LAAKNATSTVPVIFTGVTDPVRTGLVASFNNPGGNVTGIAGLTTELDTKRLELIIELVPAADVIGVLANTGRPSLEAQLQVLQQAATSRGKTIAVFRVSSEADLATALTSAAQQRIQALLVTADPFFNSRRERLTALLNQYRIPAIFGLRDIVNAGGLMSYGPNNAGIYREAGVYGARILKGAKPSDLPVAQPTKIDIVINLKVAEAQGIKVPQSLLARADEVIE
jgi:putative ABC transport system substrate-binding protein